MLVDIFSSFDDNNQVFISIYILMWGVSLLRISVFSSSYWVSQPSYEIIIKIFKDTVCSQVFRSFGYFMGGFINILGSMFLFLIIINLIGLIPYVFRTTSHLAISLSFGLPIWLSLIISAVIYNSVSVIASLLPRGAPAALNPFLVLIETVRITVRPITLSVRLIANIRAGHIVLTLVGRYLMARFLSASFYSVAFLSALQIFYTIFEFGISIIQAYIFCLLITLYSDEHPH